VTVLYDDVSRLIQRTERYGVGRWNRDTLLFIEWSAGGSVAIGRQFQRSDLVQESIIAGLALRKPDVLPVRE
jgi:hypothetical protein